MFSAIPEGMSEDTVCHYIVRVQDFYTLAHCWRAFYNLDSGAFRVRIEVTFSSNDIDLPTNFVDVRLPGARPYLQNAGDRFPAVGHALGDVFQRQLVVEQVYVAVSTPQHHVVVGRVVRLRRTAPEQLGGPVVERRAIVKTVAAQVTRFFHC